MAEERVQRRLSAILAADAVGYSRLVEADEAGTLVAVKGHLTGIFEPSISEHRGRVVKTMGDGLLAEFGSAVDAVFCARTIQDAMAVHNLEVPSARRIQFRIGINVGDIVVDGDDIHGDGVNVAARMESIAEPGGICISGVVHEHIHGKLEVSFADLGERAVKNLDRPVRVYQVLPPGAGDQKIVRRKRGTRPGWRAPAIAVAIVAVVVVAGAIVWISYPRDEASVATTEAKKLSIVVLPFENLSSDPEQAYFADAITEDLITDLSRIRAAFVIARGTAFAYKGKAVNAKQIARELNVRYVLEGSVQRKGDQVRVNAQLIDGKSGTHVWSDRFDWEFQDTFALQSAITGRIAAVLRAELLEAESIQMKKGRPENLEAWDYAVQAQVKMHAIRLGPNVISEAKKLYEKALELDPNLALAWEGLAFIHFAAATREIPGVSMPNSKNLSLEAAEKAVLLDPKSSDAHTVLGLALFWNAQRESASASCDLAIELNRNNDDAYLCAAQAYRSLGRYAEATQLLEMSQRLNPRFRAWRRHMYMGFIKIGLGDYEAAVISLRKAKAEFPTHQPVNLYLTSALALQGRQDEARAALDDYMKLATQGRDTVEKIRAERGHIDPNFDRIVEGLRLAGMPER